MDIVNAAFYDHFVNPRNVGVVEDPDGVGKRGDPDCGDFLVVTIKVEDEAIADIRFLCKGCSAAIATSSAMTELVKGERLDTAMRVTPAMIEEEVGGLPEEKRHCSLLGADALKEAVADYVSRKEEIERDRNASKGE